eukprot:3152945-Amphidinium_carterae.1
MSHRPGVQKVGLCTRFGLLGTRLLQSLRLVFVCSSRNRYINLVPRFPKVGRMRSFALYSLMSNGVSMTLCMDFAIVACLSVICQLLPTGHVNG